ncbi:MAG: quinone oxidoreductase [Nocardioidaceae bacterium]|nr:quinone oxidoreductase [Nocardioidaceae bacterium]
MTSVIVREHGGPQQLVLGDDPGRAPGTGEIAVLVAAAGVNFIDIYQRSGAYPMQLPFVAGSEAAGTVESVGAGVTDVAAGDHVAWAMVAGSGYTERAIVPVDRVVPVPDGVGDEVAAAVMLQGMTAHYLCEATYAVQPGDVALVHAGAGGVGLLLTQMIVHRGGRVISTVSTPEKAELSRDAGASDVLDYGGFAERVRELTDGEGVAVAYDGVGQATFEGSLDSLRPRGVLALFGAASGPVPAFDPQVLNSKGSLFLTRPTLGHYTADRAELVHRAGEVLDGVARGWLDVRIGGRYPLAEAARAHEDLAARRTTGKLLLIPS